MRVSFSSVRVAFKTYFANILLSVPYLLRFTPRFASFTTHSLCLIFSRSIMNMVTVVYVQ